MTDPIPQPIPGSPGELGEPGKPPPLGEGGAGGAGGDGGVGLPGKPGRRGPAGKAGRDADGRSPLLAGLRLYTAAAVLTVIALTLATTLTSRADERASDARNQAKIADLEGRLDERQDEHEAIQSVVDREQAIQDCRNLYEEDIIFARLTRDIEAGHQSASFALIPLDAPPDERLAIQQQAVDELTVKDILLIEAVSAFRRYVEADPSPDDCPHPNSN